MKKITIRQNFEAGLDELLKAREERYKHLDKFPELKNVHIEKESSSDGILYQERHIHLTDSIPQAIRAFLSSGSITLVEKSEFNEAEKTHKFEVEPGKGIDAFFQIEGTSRYFAAGENESAREYDITVKSSAFLVGPVVETAIAEIYQHNLDKDKKSIEEFIRIFKEGV